MFVGRQVSKERLLALMEQGLLAPSSVAGSTSCVWSKPGLAFLALVKDGHSGHLPEGASSDLWLCLQCFLCQHTEHRSWAMGARLPWPRFQLVVPLQRVLEKAKPAQRVQTRRAPFSPGETQVRGFTSKWSRSRNRMRRTTGKRL